MAEVARLVAEGTEGLELGENIPGAQIRPMPCFLPRSYRGYELHFRPMELRHLRYFAAVAAHGSFNRAAQILHLTQPALSRQVKDLEEEIGVPLLVRGTNAITLTPTGESFYEDARDLIARADKAIQRARGERGGEVVRVGYLSATVTGIVPPALEKFQAANPRVRIELADLDPAEMKEAAAEEQGLDIVVCCPTAKQIRFQVSAGQKLR